MIVLEDLSCSRACEELIDEADHHYEVKHCTYQKNERVKGRPYWSVYLEFEYGIPDALVYELFPLALCMFKCATQSEEASGQVERGVRMMAGPWTYGANIKYLDEPRLCDLRGVVAAVLAGASKADMWQLHSRVMACFPDLYQQTVDVQTLCSIKPLPNMIFLFGPSGCGKSHTAGDLMRIMNTSSYLHNTESKWFDRYQREDTLVIDGLDLFCKGHREISEFLLLFRKSPVLLPCEVGSRPCNATTVIITSFNPPWD